MTSSLTSRVLAVCASLSLITVAGCAADSEEGTGGGSEGVAFGATMEEYAAAFEDMDPIELTAQTTAAKGSSLGAKEEAYYAAVEEWSDGKITFDLTYANGIVSPDKAGEAVGNGTVDLSNFLPSYEPDSYPAANALMDGFIYTSPGAVTNPLHAHAYLNEVAYDTPEFIAELEAQNLHTLIPFVTIGPALIFCSEKRTDRESLEGAIASGSSQMIGEQLEAMGLTFTSLAWTEYFEGLSRNIIDCFHGASVSALAGGLTEPAPYATYSTGQSGLTYGSNTFVINKDAYENLPLVARQLMFDRLDVYLQETTKSVWDSLVETVEQLEANGGGAFPLSDESNAALEAYNEKRIADLAESDTVTDGAALVERIQGSASRWQDTVTDELGYDESISLADLGGWLETSDPDLDAWTDSIFSEALLAHRPS